MSHPFIIWTMQRTGGTSLTELLMNMSEHPGADHEPFNWRRSEPRQFGRITQRWVETKDDSVLESALSGILAERYLIKHCYELHGTPFNTRLAGVAAKADYRHILLLRRDELLRLTSKFIAEADGTWFKDYASKVYAKIRAKERVFRPLPVDKVVRHFIYCQKVTKETRECLLRLKVGVREVYYEDLYLGEQAKRLTYLDGLFDFLCMTAETVAKHRDDIESKIFDGGQKTADMLPFVPNLDEVENALAEAGYRRYESAPQEPAAWRSVTRQSAVIEVADFERAAEPEDAGAPRLIFRRGNGFVEEDQLGYRGKQLNRLNARYRIFILPNVEQIEGKRVLDLGSHDGHWTLACLMHGAEHVTAVEIRADLLEKSRSVVEGSITDRVRFIHGDVFDVLPRLAAEGERFDTILCLGIYYLIVDHHRLIQLMSRFRPRLIILDTNLVDSDDALIKLKAESAGSALSGTVSRGGINVLAAKFGYSARYEEWPDRLSNRDGLHDYYSTNKFGVRRYTLYLEADRHRPQALGISVAERAAQAPAEEMASGS